MNYWRECDGVMEQGDKVVRRYKPCGHLEQKPRDLLNPIAQKDPQIMVGHRFPCKACERDGNAQPA